MKEINLNDDIYFELTEKGKLRFEDPYFKASIYEAENGRYRTQMWKFCGLFSNCFQYPSGNLDVKTGVYFQDKDLKEVTCP